MRFPLVAGRAALLVVATSLAASIPARAAYVVTFSQVGPDVLATGSGTIDLGGLTFAASGNSDVFVVPNEPLVITGAPGAGDAYRGTVGGPGGFGPGTGTVATTGEGGIVALAIPAVGVAEIVVPPGYVSGAPLSDAATYANQTFASMGLTPGIYVYTFGSGENADTFTVDITIAEPASLALLGGGLLGLGLIQRRRKAA